MAYTGRPSGLVSGLEERFWGRDWLLLLLLRFLPSVILSFVPETPRPRFEDILCMWYWSWLGVEGSLRRERWLFC